MRALDTHPYYGLILQELLTRELLARWDLAKEEGHAPARLVKLLEATGMGDVSVYSSQLKSC